MWPDVKFLKLFVLIGAAIPLITGPLSMLGLHDPIYAMTPTADDSILDSNTRFFGGLWLVCGLALLTTLRTLDQPNPLFRWIMLGIVAGGVGRLISMAALAVPPAPFIAVTVLEIVVIPVVIVWQAKLAGTAVRVSP